jgi:hypothetical protein
VHRVLATKRGRNRRCTHFVSDVYALVTIGNLSALLTCGRTFRRSGSEVRLAAVGSGMQAVAIATNKDCSGSRKKICNHALLSRHVLGAPIVFIIPHRRNQFSSGKRCAFFPRPWRAAIAGLTRYCVRQQRLAASIQRVERRHKEVVNACKSIVGDQTRLDRALDGRSLRREDVVVTAAVGSVGGLKCSAAPPWWLGAVFGRRRQRRRLARRQTAKRMRRLYLPHRMIAALWRRS